MRIGILSPIAWRTPPRHYGPWEYFVHLLTEGLVRQKVDVTLFATADSITSAKLVAVAPRPYEEDPNLDVKVWECLHISEVFERAAEFDLIHNSFDFLPLSYSALVRTPVVTTIHGFSSPSILPVYRKYNGRVHYVSISDADRSPDLDYIATIHHGLPLEAYPFREAPEDYLLFFGRISHEKGVAEAIETARRAGYPLKIAGIIQDRRYFEERVRPALSPGRVEFLGPAGPEKRNRLLGGAVALLHLINFDEPFGFTMIESMACGTPVIAVGRGSVPEVVDPGLTGWIVRDVDGAVEAVTRVAALDRRRIREVAERRWSRERMVREYIDVYTRILSVR